MNDHKCGLCHLIENFILASCVSVVGKNYRLNNGDISYWRYHNLFVHPPSFVMVLLNSFDLPKFPVVLQPWTIVSNFDNNDNLHLIFERPTIHPNITMGINNLTHSFIDNQTDIFLDPNFFILIVLRQDSGMVAVGQKPQKPRRATPKEGHFQNWPLQRRRRRRRSRKYLLSGETTALSAKSARSSLMVSTARERGLPSENICIWPDTFA